MEGKIHLHHSHVAGEILGYGHSFCNLKVQGNKFFSPLFAHNLFGFDFFSVVKGIRLCIWRTKNFCIGGSNLTNVNYRSTNVNIVDEVKFIDTMRYYQQSLANLPNTMCDKEKVKEKSACEKFLKSHFYFKSVWSSFEDEKKNQILKYLSSGKGIVSYEEIRDMESLSVSPEDGKIFEQIEFYSELRNKLISEKEYEEARLLFKMLKMRKIGDMNNHYNFQDTIILCKISEGHGTLMHEKYSFNPRRCNSAIIALPISSETVELFEKILIGGFSCVITRIAFDTKILMSNLTSEDFDKMSIDESFTKRKRKI